MRRVVLLKEMKTHEGMEIILDVPDLEELKSLTVRKFKIYGYIILVSSIRTYIKSSHIVKHQYKELKKKIKEIRHRYVPKKKKDTHEKEASKFLKMTSEYKHKIRVLKEKIKEEEGLN